MCKEGRAAGGGGECESRRVSERSAVTDGGRFPTERARSCRGDKSAQLQRVPMRQDPQKIALRPPFGNVAQPFWHKRMDFPPRVAGFRHEGGIMRHISWRPSPSLVPSECGTKRDFPAQGGRISTRRWHNAAQILAPFTFACPWRAPFSPPQRHHGLESRTPQNPRARALARIFALGALS